MKSKAILLLMIIGIVTIVMAFTPVWKKKLDLKVFSLRIPANWRYIPQSGEDSFIGQFKLPSGAMNFDYSSKGYAGHLLATEDEYLKSEEWLAPCLFCKPGVTYTASFDVHKVKLKQMQEKGITDSSLIKVEAFPEPTKKIHKATDADRRTYPKADYIAYLTYKDSTILSPVTIPLAIKTHNIHIDSTDTYIIKTIHPKAAGRGLTGVYIQSRTSGLNFQMSGLNLSAADQLNALKAFKTITIRP